LLLLRIIVIGNVKLLIVTDHAYHLILKSPKQ